MTKKIKLESFFSTEDYSEVIISQNEAKILSKNFKNFYKSNIRIFKKALAQIFNFKYQEILINRAISPITYIFFERFFRAYKFHFIRSGNYRGDKNFYKFTKVKDLESFSERCSFSNDFNLSLISNFLKILKKDDLNNQKVINCINNYKTQNKNFKNFHLDYYSFLKKIVIKINIILERIYNRFIFYKKTPLITASTSDSAFHFHGLYLNYFSRLKNFTLINRDDFSESVREKLIKDLKESNLNLDMFLSHYNLTDDIRKNIKDYYFEFLKLNYPICFLENLEENFNYQKKILKNFKSKKIFSSDSDDSVSTLAYLVSKNLGFDILKLQHGGRCGYLNDTLEIDQIETKNSDFFLSNGWNGKIKKYDEEHHVNFVKFPSPLFTEKKKYFSSYKPSNNRKFDFTFFPQAIKPFTNDFQGSSIFRRDVIKEYVDGFWELASTFHANNINTYIKFYNNTSKNFIEKNLDQIQKKYKNTFHFQNDFNKGMTLKLLNTSNVILLDQPGTSFLECLNSGIPIMVYWKKSFSEPSDDSIKIFNELNRVGIIHENIETLIDSYKEFKINHNQWINDNKRQEVIKNFCNNYAQTDFNWPKMLKDFINK